ncbi:MAG: hypothetical protein ACREVH_01250 [Gammaproteobacteria bacterium]
MKLVFQIALGVFIGALAAHYTFDQWRTHEANRTAEVKQKELTEQKRLREKQGAKIRELLMQARRKQGEPVDIEEETLLNQGEGTAPH